MIEKFWPSKEVMLTDLIEFSVYFKLFCYNIKYYMFLHNTHK